MTKVAKRFTNKELPERAKLYKSGPKKVRPAENDAYGLTSLELGGAITFPGKTARDLRGVIAHRTQTTSMKFISETTRRGEKVSATVWRVK